MSFIIGNLWVSLDKKPILKGISLQIEEGKIYALMGPNGSGKSTFAQAVMGYTSSKLKTQNSKLEINGKDIRKLATDERAREGLFLAFQTPIGIPGVNVANLLRTAKKGISTNFSKAISGHNPALSVWQFNEQLVKIADKLHIPSDFLKKSLNEEFSGGEKKKLEMLQAIVLSPKYAIFDEIDTGLDVDALKIVAQGINELKRKNCGIIIITHYQRILKYAKPDIVHILVKGEIVESGGYKLAQEVEKNGYKKWLKK